MQNQFNGIGRVTADPVLKTFEEGKKKYLKFCVAIPRDIGNDTDFLNVTAWGKLGDVAAGILRKGCLVSVNGRIQIDTKTINNAKATFIELQLEKFYVLESKSGPKSTNKEKVEKTK